MKPVLFLNRTSCFTLMLAALVASPTSAQSSNNQGPVRRAERSARASWQPVRSSNRVDADAATVTAGARTQREATKPNDAERANPAAGQTYPVRQVGYAQARQSQARQVRPIGHAIPAPPSGGMSIVEGPLMDGSMTSEPLDGQIAFAPVYDGISSCDAMPMGSNCGCGASTCDGGCDGGCSSPSCCNFSAGSCNSCCGELCSPDSWRPCVTLCLPTDGWATFEYLMWWQDGMELPPLITTSTDPNVAQANAGVLGQPTTQTLFGGDDVLTDSFEGGRLRFGFWLDKCHTWGVGAEYFQIGSKSESYFRNSNGNPTLARPFFNVNPATGSPREDSELVAFPDVVSGAVGAEATSELVGAGFHFRRLRNCDEGCNRWLFDSCDQNYCSRTESMIGYRFLQLTETVNITENLTGIQPQANFDISDNFRTRNQFNGVDLGWVYRQTRNNWTIDGLIRLGIGVTHQQVDINGSTTISGDPTNPGSTTYSGGLLTQASNIGSYTRDEFSVIPEFNVNLGYQLNDHWRAMMGYTFIYWSNVVRPGEHISRDVNPSQLAPPEDPLTGPNRPEFDFDSVDYWVQGWSAGLEYRW
ncbi:BBP7 family outer membrane beta-barrel protein [Novipirellula herctigrandis]|uniref:BBP7 family outer membrane beta-barrel protein n=1 Tax=Novipirellula herctigrandis TaxID=2527986 RepID=UPI003AF355ED